jgi:hypothetical protein
LGQKAKVSRTKGVNDKTTADNIGNEVSGNWEESKVVSDISNNASTWRGEKFTILECV